MGIKMSEVGGKKRPPQKKRPPGKKGARKIETVKQSGTEVGAVAGHHQRRVTLNLLRHAACTPKALARVLDKLPGVEWDIHALSSKDQGTLFANVTESLANLARDEFSADLQTIRDLVREPRPGNPDAICELCGHPHIRWEFDLLNNAGGRDTKTGSVCIETYGLNVDGYGTQEAALAALKAAVAKAKRKADMQDWQDEHPEHVNDMERLNELRQWLSRNRTLRPYTLYQGVRPRWNDRATILLKTAHVSIKYYRREHFLTPTRTVQVYGSGTSTGCLRAIEDMQVEMRRAVAQIDSHRKFWEDLLKRSELDDRQRRAVNFFLQNGTDPTQAEANSAYFSTLISDYL